MIATDTGGGGIQLIDPRDPVHDPESAGSTRFKMVKQSTTFYPAGSTR